MNTPHNEPQRTGIESLLNALSDTKRSGISQVAKASQTLLANGPHGTAIIDKLRALSVAPIGPEQLQVTAALMVTIEGVEKVTLDHVRRLESLGIPARKIIYEKFELSDWREIEGKGLKGADVAEAIFQELAKMGGIEPLSADRIEELNRIPGSPTEEVLKGFENLLSTSKEVSESMKDLQRFSKKK